MPIFGAVLRNLRSLNVDMKTVLRRFGA